MNREEKIRMEVERFKKGFPWMEIVAPATPGKGIIVLNDEEVAAAAEYADKAEVKGKCKFVPASGAASRMFKDIFAGLEKLSGGNDIAPDAAAAKLAAAIEKFAFYTEELFGTPEDSLEFRRSVAEKVLTDAGLGYGSKPKGVIRFHRYEGEARTAIAEHLVEGQDYMRNADGSVNLIVTISPEHRQLFEAAIEEVKAAYEQKYGVTYDITFTYQDKETDTVAVDLENKPFLKEDGSMLFRPAGHGALIYNLNKVEKEIVSIKNIDNVAVERYLPTTAKYKKVLMGKCLELRDIIFGYLNALEQITSEAGLSIPAFLPGYNGVQEDPCATEECQQLCQEIEDFLASELCIEMPVAKNCRERVDAIISKLNRPIRVCGMVKNEGEPGGGPFIIKEKDGSTSLQILESVQIDMSNPQAVEALHSATHFNPVDLVCCLYGHDGEKFNLLEHVDENAGFISSKSYQGRELKALELPGLWNGSMSDWNTMFVEVPIETFNPVKTVLDLLKPAHQA
ncbi:MAG: DUF4301 family protein [Bacteroidales bacterium]|nr:DUF4301 family protein [Bacteroidales bacterium]